MADAAIDNPILNGPYAPPTRHWAFGPDGIVAVAEEGRRRSGYFLPIARTRTEGQQALFAAVDTNEVFSSLDDVNDLRQAVTLWREADFVGATPVSRRLLRYWSAPDRDKPLFFAQREAVETAIYLTEVAPMIREVSQRHVKRLEELSARFNPGLRRMAFKLATGAGKTTIMAMLIAWHTLNDAADPDRKRSPYSNAFLVVAPGITIRDRLRELLPSDPRSTYRQRDLVPADLVDTLHTARVSITNFHAFQRRERVTTSRLTREVLHGSADTDAFTETPRQMVRRVTAELRGARNIVVLNDEAHHCYLHASAVPAEGSANAAKLTRDERKEAEANVQDARQWSGGLTAIAEHVGIRRVYDLSATPFFLSGSGYDEGSLFPWVVSDFALIDAIESGLVKIPRVPVADDRMSPDGPTYRHLWAHVGDDLRRNKRRRKAVETDAPVLPTGVEAALHSLYGHYSQTYEAWEAAGTQGTPPVFIVVCNNTVVSKLVHDWIAGWDKAVGDDEIAHVPGKLPLFSNVSEDGIRLARPTTVLLDSRELESGDTMSGSFKEAATTEIAAFKDELRQRFPGRDADAITDEDLLREVMNTIGRPGRLGEHVRCVVSVSMLTEGWDANTVTHVLGLRAFSTQLLCEQVVGRALRRRSYELDEDGRFPVEYADVYGVPFSFLPTSGTTTPAPPPRPLTRVTALPDRGELAITMPALQGYRREVPEAELTADLSTAAYTLRPDDTPIRVEVAPIVGEDVEHSLDALRQVRHQRVAFELTAAVLDQHLRTQDGDERPHLFPQALRLCREWIDSSLTLTDNAFIGLLLLSDRFRKATDLIGAAIRLGTPGADTVEAILRPDRPELTTDVVDFDTSRPVFATTASHVSHVAADSASWERKAAFALEQLAAEGEIRSYVRNDHLEFLIPYRMSGQDRDYEPDFVVQIDDQLHLVIEVSGRERHDKQVKVATARTLWVPAVNRHGGFGLWDFVEVTDPDMTATDVRAAIDAARATAATAAS